MKTARTVLLALLFSTGISVEGASVTLAWDHLDTNVTFRIWQSIGSSAFSVISAVAQKTATIANVSTNDVTRWYVTAINVAGDESPQSNTVTNSPPPSPVNGLAFEAENGVITAPFIVSDGHIRQDVQTGLADGGRASYDFSVTNSGVYSVFTVVNAPHGGANSFFVNVDAEPTDAMIWDIPVTVQFEIRAVRWVGEATNHLFALSPGTHMLIIRGREAGTQLDRLSIVPVTLSPTPPPPAPTNLRLQAISGNRRDLGWTSDLSASSVVEKAMESDPFTQVALVPAGTLHWIDTKARQKLTRYRVKSCNAALCSAWAEITWRP